MPNDVAQLKHSFTVLSPNLIGVPRQENVFTQFDEMGILLGLDRLPGEDVIDYKHRLLDVFSHRANSTYNGLINGITRELGLHLFNAFRIEPIYSLGVFVGPNPAVVFNGPYVTVYDDILADSIEFEVDRFELDDPDAYTIQELADYINANSLVLSVNTSLSTHLVDRSMTILNQSNIKSIPVEYIPESNRFTLLYPGQRGGGIILESVFFTDNLTFKEQVSSDALVTSSGKYYVNRYTGDVISYDLPKPGTSVRYKVIMNSYDAVASPVIIHDINNNNFKRKMFEQILGDNGQYENGLPTPLGADLINELLSVYPLYYDK